MRSLLRSALSWLLLAAGIAGGIVLGIAIKHSVVWSAAFAALAALAAAIFLRGKWVRNTAVCLTTVFVCLLIGEGFVTYTQNGGHDGAAAAPVDLRPRFEPQPLFIADPALGWKLRPSSVIRAMRTRGEAVIYDATYTIGPDGHRVTPASAADGETVLFLGDSFMFGDGVPDTDTLPQRFATRTGSRFHVVNLAVSAYGPHQVLRQIEEGVVERAVGRRRVRAAYLYLIEDQLPRAAGDKAADWWWQVAPQYEVTREGLKVVGTAAEVRARRGPIERAIVESVDQSQIGKVSRRILRVFPQMALSEAILRQIRVSLAERYGAELIVLYWSADPAEFYPTLLSGMVARAGAKMLFLPSLLAPAGLTEDDVLIHDDGHPNGRLNDVIAAALAKQHAP